MIGELMKAKTTKAHLLAIFTILIWGTTFVSTKVLLKAFQPVEILAWRFAMGFLALCLILPKRLPFEGVRRELHYALAGLTGVTLYCMLENTALSYTMASNVSVIVSVAPLFTALIARKEKHGMAFYLGFAAAILGIILISFGGQEEVRVNPLGDLMALGAALSWAFYMAITKRIEGFGHSTIQTTRRIFFYGLLFSVPVLLYNGFNTDMTRFLHLPNLLNMLYLGVGASALCFVTWNWATGVLGAVRTSAYIYLNPVVTIAASMIVLDERLGVPAAIGVGLTILGLVLSEKRNHQKQTEGKA